MNYIFQSLKMATAMIVLAALSTPALAETSAYEPITPHAQGRESRRTPIVAAIEKARPAVVSIYVEYNQAAGGSRFRRDPFQEDFFNRFFGEMSPRRPSPSVSIGSGVIIDGARGLVVTNEHVVRGAGTITVTTSDGQELAAEILGADDRFDLAVLAVKSKKPLPQLPLGNSEDLMIGETVIAIGNPFGLSHSATTGVVSATGRNLPNGRGNPNSSFRDLIQTDASINPGNSGGPLVNINGEVIGINTVIQANAEGLGFAIPSDKVRRIYTRLIRNQAEDQAFHLGLDLAEAGHPEKGKTGLMVLKVKPDGPADKAGIKVGDMLMSLDGSSTPTIDDYEMIITNLTQRQAVTAEVTRGTQNLTVSLTPQPITQAEAINLAWRFYGLKATEDHGSMVLMSPAPDSPAARLGLEEGDVLLRIAARNISSQADLAQAMIEQRFYTSIAITVKRGRMIYQATLSR